MIIRPRTKGFICTTAHPLGCAENVRASAELMEGIRKSEGKGPKSVLVIGSSTGYGLASRTAAAFGYGAATLGIAFERPASGSRTASAGWYNTMAFDALAKEKGLVCQSLNGDAFSDEMKAAAADKIKTMMPGGKVDMVIYSLAAPKRTDSRTGITWSSVIKPIGASFHSQTVDFHSGALSEVTVEPASPEEMENTVKVMGGEDWLWWMEALAEQDVLDDGIVTIAYSYIGPELTHAIYRDGTIGLAKQDLDHKTLQISHMLKDKGGRAFVSVNKALVTQASSAIPVVPLYISLLYRIMKEKGLHEECPQQMKRMFERIYDRENPLDWDSLPADHEGRIRMDDWEMRPDVQQEVMALWKNINDSNITDITDLLGYQTAFLQLFGFDVPGIDYEQDIEP